MPVMTETTDGNGESVSVSESEATSSDGMRYRTLVVDKSGKSDGDDS